MLDVFLSLPSEQRISFCAAFGIGLFLFCIDAYEALAAKLARKWPMTTARIITCMAVMREDDEGHNYTFPYITYEYDAAGISYEGGDRFLARTARHMKRQLNGCATKRKFLSATIRKHLISRRLQAGLDGEPD